MHAAPVRLASLVCINPIRSLPLRREVLHVAGRRGVEVHRRNTDKTVSLTAKNSVCSISRF